MMIHRSLKVEEDIWRRMEEKARKQGFTSTNSYLRHIIQEDLSGGTLEETEERLVSTISKLSAQIQSIGTMHQASFATLWAMLEVIVGAFPHERPSQISDQRLKELRVRIAGDIRGNYLIQELGNGAPE
jgi:hypothetical protein